MFLELLMAVFIAGWLLFGFYGVGLKWADHIQWDGKIDRQYYEFAAYLLMFLGGPIAVGLWKERNAALLRQKILKTHFNPVEV